jgi:NTE family protein
VTPVLDADLVLEGGGVKGIGLVGAYDELDAAGYRVRRIAGTSAGAIVGALIAAGAPPGALAQIMREIDYRRFEDKGFLDHFGVAGRGLSALFEKGIYEGTVLRDWLHGLLSDVGAAKFGDLRITDDPHSCLPPQCSYKLVVLTSDVSQGRLVRLPWDYPRYGLDPDEQFVADAVRASMSIPIFYEPVRLQQSYLVDGGMLSNFPIDVFDRTDGKQPRWPTFGLKLSARPLSPAEERFDVHGTLSLLKSMVGTMMNFHDQMHIDDPAVLARTLFIDTLGVKATDFDIDEATQTALFENGRTAAIKFLKDWDLARYLRTHRSGGSATKA